MTATSALGRLRRENKELHINLVRSQAGYMKPCPRKEGGREEEADGRSEGVGCVSCSTEVLAPGKQEYEDQKFDVILG